MNANITGEWAHYCFDEVSGKPCCQSLQDAKEKTTRAMVNFFQAEAEPIPAESRWTHTLSNFKKTLVRKALYGVGCRCFPAGGQVELAQDGPAQDIEGQATEDFADNLNKSRLSRAIGYFNDPATFHELAALTLVLDVIDTNLLYPLLGDPILHDDSRPSKVDTLLDPNDSALGRCASGLLNLLDAWDTGSSSRVPSCVLDMVGGKAHDQECKRFARSQILRMSSSFGRRYLTRYGTWPYSLYPLSSPKFDEATKRSVATQLLVAPDEELDVYSMGVRCLFNSTEQLLSFTCQSMLAADVRSQALSTDVIERLTAEITATAPRRAPARSFATSARESFLRQVTVVHKAGGGTDPLGSSALVRSAPKETVLASPLLHATSASTLPQPLEQGASASSAVEAPGATQIQRPGALVDGSVCGDGSSAIVPQAAFFGDARVLQRDTTSCLTHELVQEGGKKRKQAGLSPYMFELDKTVAAARTRKGLSFPKMR